MSVRLATANRTLLLVSRVRSSLSSMFPASRAPTATISVPFSQVSGSTTDRRAKSAGSAATADGFTW